MSGEGERARRGRATAMAIASTALGIAAMVVSPRARSAPPAPAPPAPATEAPVAAAVASVVGEQPAARASALPERPGWVAAGAGAAFVYPPAAAADAPRPVTVLLHGMCGHPQSACGPFVDVATNRGWLVCPKGEDPCGGGTRWRLRGPDDAQLVDASVGAVAREHEGAVEAASRRVLVGFSLGGIAAVRIAQASAGVYQGLVVIASQVHPDAAALAKAGVRRVVLAAGDLDMTSAPLREDARALSVQGLPTRFVSLGRFGHGYPPDMEALMHEPMQWVAAGGS